MKCPKLYLDLETFSECDLEKAGAYQYSLHKSTRVLCATAGEKDFTLGDFNESEIADGWLQFKIKRFLEENPYGKIVAWGSFFEMCILVNTLGMGLEPEHFYDLMAVASKNALPAKLAKAGTALQLPEDLKKSRRGTQLLRWLSVPHEKNGDPELLRELQDYCRQDVVSMMAIEKRLPPLSDQDYWFWELHERINWRGIPIDTELASAASRMTDRRLASVHEEVRTLTDGVVKDGNDIHGAKRWLGVKYLNKQSVDAVKLQFAEDPTALKVIELRNLAALGSVKKFSTMEAMSQGTGRARGCYQYHRGLTGRSGGRGFQPQNLTRASVEPLDLELIHQFQDCPERWNDLTGEEPLRILSRALRQTIKASLGHELYVVDYSSVETVGQAWIAGDRDMIEVARGDMKFYENTASKHYRVPVDQVTPHQRQMGKHMTLAFGFGGAEGALHNTAAMFGTTIEPREATRAKENWRRDHPAFADSAGGRGIWRKLERAAHSAIRMPGAYFSAVGETGVKITFYKKGPILFGRMPSGRTLSYVYPKLEDGPYGSAMTYWTTAPGTGVFHKVGTWGGKLFENFTQAFCYDLFVNGLLNLDDAGFDIVMHTHDEGVIEEPVGRNRMPEIIRTFTRTPSWAEGFPLKAKGFTTKRYTK